MNNYSEHSRIKYISSSNMVVKAYSNGHLLPLGKVRDIRPKRARCMYLRITSFDPLTIPSIAPKNAFLVV